MLASDRERDAAAERIACAVGDGRLTLEEAERRIDAALHSRHCHDLTKLVADLPRAAPPLPKDSGSGSLRVGALALAAVVVLAAALLQAVAGAWELWPVAVTCLGLWGLRSRR